MRRVLKRNAFFSTLNVFATGGIYFVLYKHLLGEIGVELLGVWSLVMATVFAARISDMGFAGSVVKFVAKNSATDNDKAAAEIVETSFLTVTTIVIIVAIVIYKPLQWVLGLIVFADKLDHALVLLPYALVALCINTSSAVLLSGLDGYQRIDIRYTILMISGIIFVFAVIELLPNYGMVALGYAQVLQSVVLLTLSWIMLRRILPDVRMLMRWKVERFREVWRYAAIFQVTALLALSYEPITKSLLAYFGGIGSVGYYEMANRMVIQIRALIVNVNQIFVPVVANITETEPERLSAIYRRTYELVFLATLMLFAPFVAMTPIISDVWVGRWELEFVLYAVLLLVGWQINTLSSLAFFFNQGVGNLKPNLAGHALIALSNVLLCALLGHLYGGIGVVGAWTISLVLGSLLIQVRYHLQHRLPLRQMLPTESIPLVLVVLMSAVIAGLIYGAPLTNDYVVLSASLGVYFVIVSVALLTTRAGKRFVGEIVS